MSAKPLYIDEHPLFAERLRAIRLLYTDLDGTMLGIGGSLFIDSKRRPSLVAAEAIVSINSACLEVVICTGRNRIQAAEIARLCGWRGFIAELGCVVVPDRGAEPIYNTGVWAPDSLRAGETPFEAIDRVGALDALREAFPGKIENHTPYHTNREATHVLRGSLDINAARQVLGELDLQVEIVDNGVIHPLATTLVDVAEVHAYHLMPAGVSKSSAVALDLTRRGVDPAHAMASGDSVADVGIADSLALGVVMGNGLDDASVAEAILARENVALTRGHRSEGWAEMAISWLDAISHE